MKKSILMFTLLAILLLVARAVGAHDEPDLALGPTTERAAFFDHAVRADGGTRWIGTWRTSRSDDAPRRVGDRIRFRLRDRDYAAVWIQFDGDASDRRAMRFDEDDERWVVDVDLPLGRTRYVFVVEDFDGDVRERTDAANPRRRRGPDRRWVSEVRIDRDGDVVEERERPHRRSRRSRGADLELFDRVVGRYDRVDGLSLGLGPRLRTRDPWAPQLDGEITYGFSSDRWSARASALQPLHPAGTLRLHVSAYDRTDTVDRNGVGDGENSVATLLFREDNRDWFRREGLTFGLEADFEDHLLARVELRSDTYESLERTVIAGWGGRGDFFPNPAIDDGVQRSLFARFRVGSDLDHLWLEFENSDDALLPTDFDFTQLTVQGRSRLRLGHDGHLDLRVRYGTALSGELPRQRRYLAGGIGTVRGYRYQSLLIGDSDYGGEQMLLANAELVLDTDDFGVALFADAGQVWADRDDAVDLDDLVSSIGVGLLSDVDDHGLRLDLIRTLEGDGSFMAQFRLRRPF